MGDPTEGLTKAMSDAFSVVEMSVEDSATRSPFLSALTGHAKTASVNHVGNDLAHKVVHDTRFVEVHLGKPALKHAESVAATAGDAPSAGHEEAFADHFHMDPCFAGRDVAECIGGSSCRRLAGTLLGASDRDAAAALTKTLFRAVGATLRDNPSPALNVARAPCKIFGDIHGQFRDLLLFFVEFGCPSHRCGDVEYCEYVFNGDWSAEMNAGMSARGESGFDADVRAKLGEWAGDEVFKVIQAEFFHWLPVATVIESAVLVVHGGIGDGKWTLGDLSEIPYPGVMIQHGGYLATVFSARDYDYHDAKDTGAQNDGAIISVTHDAGADRDVLRLKAKIIQKTGV
ncbi:phosphoprotein phosphatase [Aureococcus anophagefferens]|nr:phosphoprotein phosphatase [Aureococcus anophagefferens]